MNHLYDIVFPLKVDITKYPNLKVKGIKTDSNKVTKGDLFIAIKGNNYDGHEYISQAVKSGACAIITDSQNFETMHSHQIKVENSRIALSSIAANFYNNPSKKLQVIGITGTNGKTSTAFLITSILKEAGIKVAQIGTLGIITDKKITEKGLTTPDPITLHKTFSNLEKNGFTHVVMEVSSHALDQHRVANIDFDLAIFTNLTQDHLDYHKSMHSYYLAKSRLFKSLDKKAISIINNSSEYTEKLKKASNCKVITFSKTKNSDFYFDNNLSITLNGINGQILFKNTRYKIRSKLVGDFNCENILASVSAAHMLKIKKEAIELGIQNCHVIPGRMESFDLSSGAKAIIDYAHTPDAYQKVLESINKTVFGLNNIYVVFGAGGDRDKLKRPQMAQISEKFATHTFIVPDNPRKENPKTITSDIIAGFSCNNYSLFENRQKGLEKALSLARRNDLIVILGKGRENYQKIGNLKIQHSDLKVIQNFQ